MQNKNKYYSVSYDEDIQEAVVFECVGNNNNDNSFETIEEAKFNFMIKLMNEVDEAVKEVDEFSRYYRIDYSPNNIDVIAVKVIEETKTYIRLSDIEYPIQKNELSYYNYYETIASTKNNFLAEMAMKVCKSRV